MEETEEIRHPAQAYDHAGHRPPARDKMSETRAHDAPRAAGRRPPAVCRREEHLLRHRCRHKYKDSRGTSRSHTALIDISTDAPKTVDALIDASN